MFQILLFAVVDRVVNYFAKYEKQGLYYLSHSIFNAYIMYLTLPALYDSFFNAHKMQNGTDQHMNDYLFYFHMYHIVAYLSHLKFDDWRHHIVVFLQVFTTKYVVELGKGVDIVWFFMCGLPGVFYYFPLFLSINGIIDRKHQKIVNLCANFVRVTGILYGTFISMTCHNMGLVGANPLWAGVYYMSNMWNGLYYLNAVIVDYHARKMK